MFPYPISFLKAETGLDPAAFVTEWTVGAGDTIILPSYDATPAGYTMDYDVDWGDGSSDSNVTTADIIHVFGHVKLGNILDTGEPTLLTYLTEDELEVYVDNELGVDYYKDAVENSSELFMGVSGKYSPTPPLA